MKGAWARPEAFEGRAMWIAVVFVLGSLLGESQAQVPTGRQVAQRTFPSVVLLVMEDSWGQPVALGSGFFVRQNVIATNKHVIEGAERGYAKLVGQRTKYDIMGIVGTDSARDLVLLHVAGAQVPPLFLADPSQVAVGDEVFVVGNPQGLEGTFSQGIVSGVRQIGNDTLLQITAPISPGSSGGPVLNNQGKVIGVAVAALRGGQNLNFAIPGSYLGSLLSEIKAAVPLSEARTRAEQTSIVAQLGGRNTEGVVGTNFAWDELFYEPANMERFSLTLQNRLREAIKEVYCLVIFYDSRGEPLDVSVIQYAGTIPANLGKRVQGQVPGSVKRLTTKRANPNTWELTPWTKTEVRVLDFRTVE